MWGVQVYMIDWMEETRMVGGGPTLGYGGSQWEMGGPDGIRGDTGGPDGIWGSQWDTGGPIWMWGVQVYMTDWMEEMQVLGGGPTLGYGGPDGIQGVPMGDGGPNGM